MSVLLQFAYLCSIEESIQSIFYHKRRDWQRMHLQWAQHMEEIAKTGRGRPYPEPVFPSIQAIRKQVYTRL